MRRLGEQLLRGQRAPPALAIPLLKVGEALWRLGTSVHRGVYEAGVLRARRLPVRTVCVGNVSVGGSGKTPMAALLAQRAAALGTRPMVLTRGYGGDEAAVLREALRGLGVPVGEGGDRWAVGSRVLRERPDVDLAILDDGMQHFALQRDVNVVMANALHGCEGSYAHVVPRGALREPWQTALARADAVVLHHADLAGHDAAQTMGRRLRDLARRDIPLFFSRMRPVALRPAFGDPPGRALGEGGAPVIAFSGVGCHEAFERAVAASLPAGVRAGAAVRFADHHPFDHADVARLARMDGALVTTQKDLARSRDALKRGLGRRLWVLESELEVLHGGEPALVALILGRK